jgi:hypothetical protein
MIPPRNAGPIILGATGRHLCHRNGVKKFAFDKLPWSIVGVGDLQYRRLSLLHKGLVRGVNAVAGYDDIFASSEDTPSLRLR